MHRRSCAARRVDHNRTRGCNRRNLPPLSPKGIPHEPTAQKGDARDGRNGRGDGAERFTRETRDIVVDAERGSPE